MRVILFLLLSVVSISLFGAEYPLQRVEKFNQKQENTILLPTDFAGHIIIDATALKALMGKRIYLVDLVYTEYKSSPTFDQVSLNQNRIVQLKKLLPQVVSDQPEWTLIEQTGAKTRDVARTYYHGFVIHYGDPLDLGTVMNYFDTFTTPMTTYAVDNSSSKVVTHESGTVIHIDANSVTHKNGKPVDGSYDLVYREFRNPAEIALSGIPMTYTENGADLHFNSVGMYEINAFQGDEELVLQKPISVDFKCTKPDTGVSFYALNSEGEWKSLRDIQFEGNTGSSNASVTLSSDQQVSSKDLAEGGSSELETITTSWDASESRPRISVTTSAGSKYDVSTLTQDTWKVYIDIKTKEPAKFDKLVLNEDPPERKLQIVKNGHMALVNLLAGISIAGFINYATDNTNNNNVVKGLQSAGFGIYNCDKVFKIQNQVSISPIYKDKKTGEEISQKYLARLIDLKYNSSFAYHPNRITFDSQGRNVLLLFTEDKRIFMLGETDFADLNITDPAEVSMQMTDVTDKINSPKDLKTLLNI